LYFLYRRYGPKEPIVFGAVFWLVVLALLAPFFAIEGANLLYPYNVGSSMSIDGFTVLNLIRLTYGLPYHAMHPGMLLKDSNPQDPMNYDGSNPFNIFLKFLEKPFTLVGLVLPLYLIISHRTRDDEFELVRNTVVFIAAFMVFSKSFYDIYFLWFFPFLLILFGKDLKEPKNTNLIGMALVWAAVALWAWAWSAQYWRSSFEYVMLWASMGIAVVGTYLAYGLFERKKRILLTCLLSIHIYGQSMNSFPFHLFYPLISRFVGAEFFRRLVYYVGYYILIISTLAIIYLLVKEAFKEPQENAVSS
jgi:hypothetical protein